LRRRNIVLTALLISFVCFCLQSQVYASLPGLGEGATLFYKGTRMGSSGQGSYETSDNLFRILTLNQTALVLQIDSSSAASNVSSEVTAIYQSGIPTYVDSLTALIYLPPECIIQSLQGNLEWTKQIDTRTPANVTEETSQTLNFTVQAGTFQSINITLALTGPDFGTLTFIYDVASGILIYEQWVPSYGDVIVLSLMAATYSHTMQQTIFNLILSVATLVIPAATAIRQAQRLLKRRGHIHEKRPEEAEIGRAHV